MLKLHPPIWTLIYIVLCSALSWSLGWPTVPGLPLPLLGIVLVALAFVPPVWAFILFRREDTEINPTSPANRKLVPRDPYQFTRNPMYLGLVTLADFFRNPMRRSSITQPRSVGTSSKAALFAGSKIFYFSSYEDSNEGDIGRCLVPRL
jgi:protein-S-isoprenylcysteine O-methyltransferase Ste14